MKPGAVNPSESLAVQLATKDAEITALKIELDAKNAELEDLKKEVRSTRFSALPYFRFEIDLFVHYPGEGCAG